MIEGFPIKGKKERGICAEAKWLRWAQFAIAETEHAAAGAQVSESPNDLHQSLVQGVLAVQNGSSKLSHRR